MPRISIDITPEEHQKLKAIAALKGQSIKAYVLKCTLAEAPDLSGMDEREALEALKTALAPRIASAHRKRLSRRSVTEIAKSAKKKLARQ